MSLTVQYIIVGLLLAGVAVYIVRKLISLKRKGGVDSCCGCSLADTCDKNRKHNRTPKDCCHENNKNME